MISKELRSKIKRIEIFSKRLMKTGLSGDYLSAFKGAGLEFEKIREYQSGDDVRFIDWNSSARSNKIMVKQFVEERERTVILVIDISASSLYSSKEDLKKDLIANVASSLSFIASNSNDNVGALFFSDKVEKWIPPAKGDLHVGKIIENIFTIKPSGVRTNILETLKFLIKLKKKNAIVFMISDWLDDISSYSKILKVVSCEYDFLGVRVLDDCEKNFPDVGLLQCKDLESGKEVFINTGGKDKDGNVLGKILKMRCLEQDRLFTKYKIDLLDLTVGRQFVNPMVSFFRKRIRRQI